MLARELSAPILLGTSNKGKLSEISAFARRLGFDVFGLHDLRLSALGDPPSVAETAGSYEGNARLKAIAYSRWAGRSCIADDTGLEIPLLGYLPGVYTAPWGADRVQAALGARRKVPARFVCWMVYSEPRGRTVSVSGVVDGELRDFESSRATGPLPYSAFFYPRGLNQPMSVLLKDGFTGTHRFLALENLARSLS